MTDVLFYHLERTTLERVLPGLLEKSLERGWRAVIVTGVAERLDALDTQLWTFREDSFLPHACLGAGDDGAQPILLMDAKSFQTAPVPNRAEVLFLIEDATATLEQLTAFTRAVVIFDGRNDDAVSAARGYWKSLRDDDPGTVALTYWQQGNNGRWEKRG